MSIEEFEIRQKEALRVIPEQYHKRVSELAWEYGHSAGFHEVLYYLEDLISIFK